MITHTRRKRKPNNQGSVFVFPGQGSQYVGMGREIYDESPAARAVFDQADKVLDMDVTRMCFEGPEADLEQTYNQQPSILTVSMACLAALRERAAAVGRKLNPAFVAGHSMGEYSAMVAADVMDFADALRLVRERGRLMEESSVKAPGGMAAVIGLDPATLEAVIHRARELGEIALANMNSPLQTVISGEVGALLRAMDLAREAGARRVARLKISIASHSPLMQHAASQLSERLAHIHLRDPRIPIVANITGQVLHSAGEVKRELGEQLCKPVQWTRSVLEMTNSGSRTFIEIGPGSVLSGLIRRIDDDVEVHSYRDVDIEKSLDAHAHAMSDRRTDPVVITGLGILCPVGIGVAPAWEALLAGQSGVARITHFDPSPFTIQFAGEVKGFDPSTLGEQKEVRRMDRCTLLSVAAARQALDDARLDRQSLDPETCGIVIGSAAGGIETLLEQHKIFLERGPRRVSPFFIQNMLVDSPAGQAAIALGLQGPNMAVVSACATGTQAVGEAAEVIRRGDADVMLAGGAEAPIHPLILAGFTVMGALGRNNEAPERASSPFTRRRDGFVLSEGAAVVVLERLDRALARGAHIYAEVGGYAATNDAYDMAAMPEKGAMAAQAMRRALRYACMGPADIDYINAHGTSTPANDGTETRAIKAVFGEHAYKLAVSSTKSMTGHMMGASGAVETVVCALAIRDQIVPPTINLDDPDPECDLDYVPNVARRMPIRATLSNSFGLGGHNASIVLKRYRDA